MQRENRASQGRNKRKGFTLIEMMVVVAIVGVLASLVVPAYQEHITKARLAEVFVMISGFKTTVAECLLVGNKHKNCNLEDSGSNTDMSDASKYIKNIWMSNVGDFTINLDWDELSNIDIEPNSSGQYWIHMTPTLNKDGGLSWECGVRPEALYQFVPMNCRNDQPDKPDEDS